MTEGCIAALPHRYPANPGRTPPYVSQGTISALRAGTSYRLRSETPPAGGSARIVPEALRRRNPERRAFTPAGGPCASPEGY